MRKRSVQTSAGKLRGGPMTDEVILCDYHEDQVSQCGTCGTHLMSAAEAAALRVVAEKARLVDLVYEDRLPVVRGSFELMRALVQLDRVAPQVVTVSEPPTGLDEEVVKYAVFRAKRHIGEHLGLHESKCEDVRNILDAIDKLRSPGEAPIATRKCKDCDRIIIEEGHRADCEHVDQPCRERTHGQWVAADPEPALAGLCTQVESKNNERRSCDLEPAPPAGPIGTEAQAEVRLLPGDGGAGRSGTMEASEPALGVQGSPRAGGEGSGSSWSVLPTGDQRNRGSDPRSEADARIAAAPNASQARRHVAVYEPRCPVTSDSREQCVSVFGHDGKCDFGSRVADDPFDSDRDSDLTQSTRPDLRTLLAAHYLAGIECDHEAKTDKASCACSMVALPVCSSVGAAVQSWIDHVLAVAVADRPGERFQVGDQVSTPDGTGTVFDSTSDDGTVGVNLPGQGSFTYQPDELAPNDAPTETLVLSHREAELIREHVMGDLRHHAKEEFITFFQRRLEPFVLAKWDAEEAAEGSTPV